MEKKIIILGSGLSGLCVAYFLKRKGISSLLLEARNRTGGRIYTKYSDDEAPQEMGATWFGKKHVNLIRLLKELEIESFKQELGTKAVYEPISTSPPQLVTLPPNEEPSFRIKNGSSNLIDTLISHLNKDQIKVNCKVEQIIFDNKRFKIKSDKETFTADYLVSTLPPNLLVNTIKFNPELPKQLTEIAISTHTWMAESIKVSLAFKEAFWREQSSGTMFSNVGPVSELYDHSDYNDKKFALKGFMNGGFFGASQEERKKFVLNQLKKYYGNKINSYSSYSDYVWKNDEFTFSPYESYILPHQNNGNKIYQEPFSEGHLYIGGSETATHYPGYMDGAVESALSISDKILKIIM